MARIGKTMNVAVEPGLSERFDRLAQVRTELVRPKDPSAVVTSWQLKGEALRRGLELLEQEAGIGVEEVAS